MKKSPIKVLIRMRPTSNFAHQQMNVDEQAGYSSPYLDQSTFMSKGLSRQVSSTISKINGVSNSKRSSPTHPNKSSTISAPNKYLPVLLRVILAAFYAMAKQGQERLSQ